MLVKEVKLIEEEKIIKLTVKINDVENNKQCRKSIKTKLGSLLLVELIEGGGKGRQ